MVTATDIAKSQIRRMLAEHDLSDSALRMGVRGGGCSGLSYTLGFDTEISETDSVFEVAEGLRIVVDPKSLRYLDGTELDFTHDLIDGGFKFNNPNAKRSCGCNTSFHA